jgi:hypothetical protein
MSDLGEAYGHQSDIYQALQINDLNSTKCRGTNSWTPKSVEIDFMEINKTIRAKIKAIKFLEMGKDAEYWGGHYGAQFKGESVFYDPKEDCSKKSILKCFSV